jgi:hypothetical protein
MTESTVPHEFAAAAEVNAAAQTVLYAPDGTAIRVAEADAATLLALGFSRESTDPAAALSDLLALIPSVAPAWQAYLDATQAAGLIDAAAQDTAIAALDLVAQAANRLHLSIHRRYRLPEAGNQEA